MQVLQDVDLVVLRCTDGWLVVFCNYRWLGFLQSVLTQKEAKFNSTDLNIAYKMPVSEYTQLCEYSEALEENWGKPPGQLNSNGQELLVYGKQFGNIFIGVQPTFGYEGDPMRLLFSRWGGWWGGVQQVGRRSGQRKLLLAGWWCCRAHLWDGPLWKSGVAEMI
jgi:hypothetical protein